MSAEKDAKIQTWSSLPLPARDAVGFGRKLSCGRVHPHAAVGLNEAAVWYHSSRVQPSILHETARPARQTAQHRRPEIQSLARSAGGTLPASVHRHGLRLLRVLAAADAGSGDHGAGHLPGRDGLSGTAHQHDLRLGQAASRLDLHTVLRVPRIERRGVRAVARAGGPAPGGRRGNRLLVRRLEHRGGRRGTPPNCGSFGSVPG